MSRKPGRRYFPHGPKRSRSYVPFWGEIPDGYDVTIEVHGFLEDA